MSVNKPWDRPWSMEEIIEHSESWNLAGDVALLNTLKAFADNLLTRTTEINNNLENLTKNLDETSLQLNIAQNQFQGLRNTQFIESRVYEDDESLPHVEDVKVEKEDKSGDLTEDVRLAALKGLEVLEKYFDKVDVAVSDSEDEDIDLPSYVLRPKDLYIHRPLPYIIGSEEWHKKWHVGLEDSSTDSETEKASDKFSESDSESDLPIIQDRSQIKETSDTSSELDFSQKNRVNNFHSSDSDNSVPAQSTGRNFAEELAAKLGNVIQDYEEPQINKRPIQPVQNYGDIFFDEPPPLDEPRGLFSGGGTLFDDDEDQKGGLFDSDEDVVDRTQPVKKDPLFDEEPPEVEEKLKKPVGGVSILGGGGLFDRKLLRRPSSEEEEKKVDLFGDDDLFGGSKATKKVDESKPKVKINLFDSDEEEKAGLFVEEEPKKVKEEPKRVEEEPKKVEEPEKTRLFEDKEIPKPPEKKITLFDDDDDLFKDDLFSSNATKKFTSGLFDDVPEDDLFSTDFEEKPKESKLFDDHSINVDMEIEKKPPKEESDEPDFKKDDFFEPPPEEPPILTKKPTEDIFDPPQPEPKPRLSLFDEDFFTSKKPPTQIPSLSLFDPNPPPDDEWDTKSDNLSENEDINDFEDVTNTSKTSLFSEEPPSLDSIPESPAKTKPGKLKHNLNINVGALMPGALPPKRDNVVKTSFSDDSTTSQMNVSPINIPTSPTNASATAFNDEVEVLHSVTKDRGKGPLNRRPSTRRGRKAALKKSDSDFKLDKQENEDESDETSPKKDIFGSQPSDQQPKRLFSDEDDNEPPKPAPKAPKGLFDDEDDDDDLFAAKKPSQPTVKKSLFDDDENEDDDDIFKSFSSASAKMHDTKMAAEKKIPKLSSVKKLENTKPEEDPLSALLK